jgi:rubrerythrin
MHDHRRGKEKTHVETETQLDRGSFIAKGALAAGAAYGVLAAGPFLRRAMAQGEASQGDLDILNFALTLEFLEAAFYEQAISELKPSGELGSLVETISSDENEHVDALSATISDLGGEPVKAPDVDFGGAFGSEDAFLELAQTFEDTGVSAYNGAAPSLESKELLATAGAIVQVEARHAAAIRLLRGELPADAAFDKTLSEDEVLKAVQPFIRS